MLEIQEDRVQLRDPSYLPTYVDILKAFPMITDGSNNTSSEWQDFCRASERREFHFFFDLLNAEFIDSLSSYLKDRSRILEIVTGHQIKVLEVGAGNGRLAHFLRQRLPQEAISYIPTDNGQLALPPAFLNEPVEELSYLQALNKYNPEIVICSWMPPEDWTYAFRANPKVSEYILIGSSDYCGDDWLTWGIPLHNQAGHPPYMMDGFSRERLEEISKYQICRADFSPFNSSRSGTVSFRRTF